MHTSSFFSTNSTSFVPLVLTKTTGTEQIESLDQFTTWQRDESDSTGLTFSAKHQNDGRTAFLRLLPSLVDNSAKERLRSRLRLIQWLGPRFGADRIQDRLDDTPPSIVAYRAERITLDRWLQDAIPEQRLRLAAELIDLMIKAHSVGLSHGCLTSQSISIDCTGNDSVGKGCIDFLRANFEADSTEAAESLTKDLAAIEAIIRTMLKPILADSVWTSQLRGQSRARLNRLVKYQPQPDDMYEAIAHWRELLTEILRQINVGSSSNDACANEASDGAALSNERRSLRSKESTDNQQKQSECASGTQPNSVSQPADDRTCEEVVQPVSQPSDGEADESDTTEEIDQATALAASQDFLAHAPRPGDMISRFQLESQIGQGGMGIVFKGTDIATKQPVAVKILRAMGGDITHAIRRFRKEARLLESVQNEFVTRLIETGVENGQHYLAMEFVDGTNLKDWLHEHETLDEATSLKLIEDVARALVDAHAREIVHRDIKPENILLARLPDCDGPAESASLSQLRVKLSDFGIARQIRQSASMEMTRAGSLLGTPLYMSPEQCKSTERIGPSSDVYSLGVLLYRLLTGTVPFESDDPMKLAAMHCFDIPVSVQKRNRSISDAASNLVARMLAKNPADRPADAAQVISEIERLLSGEASPFEAHPKLPILAETKVWKRVFEWDLLSSPIELWPYVSNTERLNRAAGLPSVKYRTEKDPQLGLRKFGEFKLAGMKIQWEEHPFEWIEGTRMGVLREFASGPFRWFSSVVELEPRAEGGTRLTHTVRIEPRNLMGRLVAQIEAGWKGGKALDRIYRRIDRWLQSQQAKSLDDPYEAAKSLERAAQRRLEQRLEAIVEHGVSWETATKLGDFLKKAAPQTLAQIRPLELADTLGVPSEELLDACFLAARQNLLVLRWDILCPTCRAPASSVGWLNQVNQHTGCEACDTEFQSNLANAIELVFQAHPEIRQVDSGQYCIGGPEHSPHVVTQLRVTAGERLEVFVPLTSGDYLLRGPRLPKALPLHVRSQAAPSQLDVALSRIGTSSHTPVVRAGRVAVRLTNDIDTTHVVRIERTINRSRVVTAAVASALPKFRELFPDQVFRRDIPVTTEDLTFLAVRVCRAEEIYSSRAEADAYLVIQQALQVAENCVSAHQGATVKSVGESLLATFQGCSDAVQAAFELSSRLREIAELRGIECVCAVHRGTALVTTQNGRLDYFGQTARTVEALVQDDQPTVVLTDAVFTNDEVTRWLSQAQRHAQTRTQSLPGGATRLVQSYDNCR